MSNNDNYSLSNVSDYSIKQLSKINTIVKPKFGKKCDIA